MSYYYYAFLIIGLALTIMLIYVYGQRKKDLPFDLFVAALKNENDGLFETAVITYETALDEIKKNKFRGDHLKSKIIGRLKVLHTNIDYNNNLRFTR
jgi:hypothetical protein